MSLSNNVAAVKAAVLRTNIDTLTDYVQLLGKFGQVSVDGAGAVTVGGRLFSDAEMFALGEAMGICV